MPLSETNKKQSQSIEDLIAQLDIPANQSNGDNQQPSMASIKDGLMNSSSASSVNTSAAAAAAAAAAARRQMKGRRTYSTSSSGMMNSNGVGSNGHNHVMFSKTPSFGQNSEPVLSKNAITSKKYSKKLGRLRNGGAPKKDGGGGKHTWGVPGCELAADDYLDSKDPNYDSEEAGNVVMVCTETRAKVKESGNLET